MPDDNAALTGWYCDSAPGGGAGVLQKCGNLAASVGVAGTSTLSTPYTGDIGDRASVPAGTNPTINTSPSANAIRAAQLGFKLAGTVLFDGYTMLSGLTKAASASDKISLSFWIAPDGPAQGTILSSPFQSYMAIPDNVASSAQEEFDNWMQISPFAGAGIASSLSNAPNGGAPYIASVNIPASGALTGSPVFNSNVSAIAGGVASWSYGNGGSVTFGANATPSYSSGSDGIFFHVMISMQASGGQLLITVAVNDTVILSGAAMNSVITSDPSEPWLFPYGNVTASSGGTVFPPLADGATQAVSNLVSGLNVWNIGGSMIDFAEEIGVNEQWGLTPEGNGMLGAVTELWIAEGHFVDWTVLANRQKFHTKDITNQVWVPVDIGAHGSTPFGYKPTIYCTGGPADFVKNRVNNTTMSVFKGTSNSLSLDFRVPGAL